MKLRGRGALQVFYRVLYTFSLGSILIRRYGEAGATRLFVVTGDLRIPASPPGKTQLGRWVVAIDFDQNGVGGHKVVRGNWVEDPIFSSGQTQMGGWWKNILLKMESGVTGLFVVIGLKFPSFTLAKPNWVGRRQ